VNKYSLIILVLILSCSFNPNSKFWSETKKLEIDKFTTKTLFKNENPNKFEFNEKLRISLPNVDNVNTNIKTNNDGYVNFTISKEYSSKFKFGKIEKFSSYEPEILINKKNLYFFDNKGSLIKFDNNSNVVWKKNYYSKSDKKSQPILFMASEENNIFVADTVANYYVIDSMSGDLRWKKKHSSSFNSQIKVKNGKAFVVDLQNNLRCFSINDGKVLWTVPTNLTVVSSQKKQSIILVDKIVYFTNSIGDVTAIDSASGDIIWQTPTQTLGFAKNITLRTSDLVSDGKNVYLSNNKNEFFAIDSKTGIIIWKQKINSELRPVIILNYLITISNEGLLVIIEKNKGNIIRVNDILKDIKTKKRREYSPVGFIIGASKIYMTTKNGRLFIINFEDAKIDKILKLDREKMQRPSFFNGELYIAKDNSIIRFN